MVAYGDKEYDTVYNCAQINLFSMCMRQLVCNQCVFNKVVQKSLFKNIVQIDNKKNVGFMINQHDLNTELLIC